MVRCLNDSTNRALRSIAFIPSAGTRAKPGLVGGQRVPKDTPRIEAYGTVDELNAFVGLAAVSCAEDSRLAPLAAILPACSRSYSTSGRFWRRNLWMCIRISRAMTGAEIAQLEREIDAMNADLRAAAQLRAPRGNPSERRTSRDADGLPAGGTLAGSDGPRRIGTGRNDPVSRIA